MKPTSSALHLIRFLLSWLLPSCAYTSSVVNVHCKYSHCCACGNSKSMRSGRNNHRLVRENKRLEFIAKIKCTSKSEVARLVFLSSIDKPSTTVSGWRTVEAVKMWTDFDWSSRYTRGNKILMDEMATSSDQPYDYRFPGCVLAVACICLPWKMTGMLEEDKYF